MEIRIEEGRKGKRRKEGREKKCKQRNFRNN